MFFFFQIFAKYVGFGDDTYDINEGLQDLSPVSLYTGNFLVGLQTALHRSNCSMDLKCLNVER